MKTTILALLLMSSPLLAQDVTFSGKVENGEGVCHDCPGFDFVLDYTHTSISSATIDLKPFVGLYVKGEGHWNGSVTTPALDVTSLTVVPQSFSIGGGGSIGKTLKFTTFASPGDLAFVMASTKDSFVPSPGVGILFLDPLHLSFLGSGFVGGGGEFTLKVDVPNDPALIGLSVFGQAGLFTGGALTTTNSDLKVISN